MLLGTVLGIDPWLALGCFAIVLTGAAVQGALGIGMGLLAAPLLGLADPAFLPVSMVVGVIPLSIGVAFRDRDHVERRQVLLALGGRLPGVALGVWVLGLTDEGFIAVVVGLSVLIAVLGSMTGFHFTTTPRSLFAAGAASGFAGTTAGVGGPPMAITYQHSRPDTMRATLALFFAGGAVMSLTALLVAGEVGRREAELALFVLPAVLAGLGLSRLLVGHVSPARLRPIVLIVCSASALGLLIEEVF